jgi:hypothetical protein
MNLEIWFDVTQMVGRAKLTGSFCANEGPSVISRLREIFKGKEPCNLLIDILSDNEEGNKIFLQWLSENALELNLDKIAVVTCRGVKNCFIQENQESVQGG